ncbi:Acyl-CoA oxidase [Balamuthia mandrillaris]
MEVQQSEHARRVAQRLRVVSAHLECNPTASKLEEVEEVAETEVDSAELEGGSTGHGLGPLPALSSQHVQKLSSMMFHHHHELRQKLYEIFKDPLFHPRYDLTMQQHRELTLQRMKILAANGVANGKSLFTNGLSVVALQETLVLVDVSLSVKAGVQWGLFAGSIASLGTERHHDQYLPLTDSLEILGCFALTELGHGSNARAIETTATYSPETEEFIIHSPTATSQKYWIGNAAKDGNMATVFAQLYLPDGRKEGVHAFLVPIRRRSQDGKSTEPMPGVGIADCGPKMGLNGVDNGKLWFDHVRIPRANLLDYYGRVNADGSYETSIPHRGKRFNTMLDALVAGRLSVGSSALNATKLALTIATKYAITRKQFGPPREEEVVIMDYLTHQRRLLPLIASTYAYRFGSNHAKDIFTQLLKNRNDERVKREIFLLAGALKAVCTWHRSEAHQTCRECCGGQGFAAENRIGVLKADCDIDLTYEGDNTILLQAIAKALMEEFRNRLSGRKGVTSMLTYFSGQIGVVLRNKNPLTRRITSEVHLLDPEFCLDAFIYKEFKLLRTVVSQLRRKVKMLKMPVFEAWNSSLDDVLMLGRAYVERVCMERFIENINQLDDQKDASLKTLLKHVCSLYGLSRIEASLGWYMQAHYFAPNKAKAITKEINRLCRALRPHAEALVDGFGLPEHIIFAPIADDWVKACSQEYECSSPSNNNRE